MVERLTVRQAGARLGVSPTTIRRMIAGGELRAEREHRPQGVRWIVLLDSDADAPHHAPDRASGTSLVTNALVTDLRERVAFLERLTEHQAGQISELIRRLPELQPGSPEPNPSPAGMGEATLPQSPPSPPGLDKLVTALQESARAPPRRGWLSRLLRL